MQLVLPDFGWILRKDTSNIVKTCVGLHSYSVLQTWKSRKWGIHQLCFQRLQAVSFWLINPTEDCPLSLQSSLFSRVATQAEFGANLRSALQIVRKKLEFSQSFAVFKSVYVSIRACHHFNAARANDTSELTMNLTKSFHFVRFIVTPVISITSELVEHGQYVRMSFATILPRHLNEKGQAATCLSGLRQPSSLARPWDALQQKRRACTAEKSIIGRIPCLSEIIYCNFYFSISTIRIQTLKRRRLTCQVDTPVHLQYQVRVPDRDCGQFLIIDAKVERTVFIWNEHNW